MKSSIILAIVSVLCLVGCKDSSSPSGSDGNNTTGDLAGKISMTDYHDDPKADKSGVLVQLDGTSYSAITDTGGNWIIHNLPSRTYSLTFSKEGCATWRDRSYSFLGGGLVRYQYFSLFDNNYWLQTVVDIREEPRFTMHLDAIILPKVIYSDSLKEDVTIYGGIYAHTSNDAPGGKALGTVIISGSDTNLSIEHEHSYRNSLFYGGSFYVGGYHDSTANFINTYFGNLLDGFSSGDIVYFRVYPCIGAYTYYDATTDKQVPYGYSRNGSNVLSAVMP